MDTKLLKTHGFYIILILILVIILLATLRFSGNTELVSYISFASTISSLFLAIIAIIYSFVSNNSLNQTIGQFSNITDQITKNANTISEATNNLDKKIEQIPEYIKTVEKNTNETLGIVKDWAINNSQTNPDPNEKDSSSELNNSQIESYLIQSSFAGKILLYACSISNSKNKEFNLSNLAEVNMEDYLTGYLISSSALNLLEFEINTIEKKRYYKVISLHEVISDKIKDTLYDNANEHDKDSPDEESWVNWIRLVEKLFK